MRYSTILISALAGFILPAFAQTGTNCDIVKNVTVVSGDTLSVIAETNRVTLAQVLFVNPQITNPGFINVGDIIKIPDCRCVAPSTAPAPNPTATCVSGGPSTTVVVAGDTLTIIANNKLGITLAALLAVNPQITNINAINAGDIINVPVC